MVGKGMEQKKSPSARVIPREYSSSSSSCEKDIQLGQCKSVSGGEVDKRANHQQGGQGSRVRSLIANFDIRQLTGFTPHIHYAITLGVMESSSERRCRAKT